MDKQDVRRSATRKFIENFDQQFSESLQEAQSKKSGSQTEHTYSTNEKPQSDEKINLSDLEAAIADIDEYMKINKKEPPSSSPD